MVLGWSAGESSVTIVVSSQVAQLRSTSSLQPIRAQYWLYTDQSQRSAVKLCTNHSAVLLLPVDHGGLAGHGAVEVDHGDSLLIGPDHARLHHLHSQPEISMVRFRPIIGQYCQVYTNQSPVLPVQTRAPPTRRPIRSLHLLAGYWPSSTAKEDVNMFKR